jgi:hypothetical protein
MTDNYLSADLASKGEGCELASVDTLLVQVPDVNLYASMILGGDQLVCPRAARRIYPWDTVLRSFLHMD